MPVVFFVDPAFASDPEMRGVSKITLGYTFFRAPPIRRRQRTFRASSRMPRRTPSTARNCLASAAPPVTRSKATRPARCSAAWSAAAPGRLRATTIRRHSRPRVSSGQPAISTSGWPILKNSYAARECRFAFLTRRRAGTSSPIWNEKVSNPATDPRRKRQMDQDPRVQSACRPAQGFTLGDLL